MPQILSEKEDQGDQLSKFPEYSQVIVKKKTKDQAVHETSKLSKYQINSKLQFFTFTKDIKNIKRSKNVFNAHYALAEKVILIFNMSLSNLNILLYLIQNIL